MKFLRLFAVISAIIFIAFANIARSADIAPEKLVEIKRMIKLVGIENAMEQMLPQMMDVMRQAEPSLPPEFYTKFMEKARAKRLVDVVIPLYDKYYTLEDLRAINEFYASPAGQKITATLPQIMQESIKIGQKWGEQLGMETMAEITRERNAKNQ